MQYRQDVRHIANYHKRKHFPSQGRRLARDVGGDRSGPKKTFFRRPPQMAKFGGTRWFLTNS